MTTEKEFWEFADRYFRTLTSIQNIIDELKVSGGLSKDVRAIKAMKRVENVMKEFDEQKPDQATIKQQNQTLLHIKAELKFIKQHPFDMVLVGGSIENMSRVIEGQTEPFIDGECVGCCKVVDIAAKLQEELYAIDKEELDRLKNVISARDLTIKSLTTMCQSSETEVDRLRDIIRTEHTHTTDLLKGIKSKFHKIAALEAELSARKEDSAVLKNVVEIVREWQNLSAMVSTYDMRRLRDLVKDYLDAPEVPPETPIDEKQEITVTFAYRELP